MIRRKANNKEMKGDTAFLDIFGLADPSKKVLLDIITHGDSTVSDIAARLDMPKSTVYDAVAPLLDESLINEYDDGRGRSFGVSDPEQLSRAHEKKIADLRAAQSSLLSFIKGKHRESAVARPRIKFYAGELGVKQAFRDMPWQKDIREAFLFWPAKDMIRIDEAFFKWHGTQRFKYGVFIYAVENHEDRAIQGDAKHEWLRDGRDNLTDIRYLPKGAGSKMSFWLYGNKCLFASGGAEKIAFTVHSKEFAEMMQLVWQSLWEGAAA